MFQTIYVFLNVFVLESRVVLIVKGRFLDVLGQVDFVTSQVGEVVFVELDLGWIFEQLLFLRKIPPSQHLT